MSFVLPLEPNERDIKPFVVVCEGMGDATFVSQLLKHLGIANCCVGCPNPKFSGGQGVDRIPQYLAAIQAVTKGRAVLSGISVVADANRSRQKRFKLIKKGFQSAGFPKPKSPFAILPGPPRVGVFFIPRKGKSGTLEHLLLEAVFKKRPRLEHCVEEFRRCAKTSGTWKENEKVKMKLSALVAVTCRKNPWASCNTMWSDNGCPVPIRSRCFKEIGDFLVAFTK